MRKAFLALLVLGGCSGDPALEAAGKRIGESRAAYNLPAYPPDCRRRARSGVRMGDTLDVALLKTDQALTRANRRGQRCAGWYDELKQKADGGNG